MEARTTNPQAPEPEPVGTGRPRSGGPFASRPDPRAGEERRVRGEAAATVRGVVVGLLVTGVVVVGRRAGVLDGSVGLVLGAVLALAVPTSRLLSRRVLLTGCLAFGWLPILWWWDLPTGGVGRVTLLLALTSGVLAGWVAAGRRPGLRVRRLVPRVATVDVLTGGALAAALSMLSPWWVARSGASALAMLSLGWDNSAHFDMTEMIRAHGAVVSAVGAPPGGGTWSYVNYPQGYHSIAAATMELVGSPHLGSAGAEVALYARSMGLVAVAAVVMVVAGIASVPALRRRPLIAAVAVVVVGAGFLWGPGGLVLEDGFPNFFLACALVAAVPLVALPIARWPSPLLLAALGGALVGIAASWALLLTMAAPVALAILLPARRSRARASRRSWAISVVIAVVTGAVIVREVLVIGVQPLTSILTLGGGVTHRPLIETDVVVSLAILIVLVLALRSRRPWSGAVARLVGATGGLAVGVAFAAWIAYVQTRTGPLSYYFWKYAISLELLALVLGAVALATLMARSRLLAGSTWGTPAAAAAVVVIVGAGFGAPYPTITTVTHLPESAGLIAHVRLALASMDPSPQIRELLAATSASPPVAQRSVYVPIGNPGMPDSAVLGQWNAALTGTWTDDRNRPIGMLVGSDMSLVGGTDVVRELLKSDPTLVVVVPPEYAGLVRTAVGSASGERVRTW